MKQTFMIIMMIFTINSLKSQVYYDSKFHKLTNKDGASYYRMIDTTEFEVIERTYFFSDTLSEIVSYSKTKERIRQGKNYQYYESGKLKYEIDYNDNRLNGYVKGFFENGLQRRHDLYKNDTLIDGKCFTEYGKDTAYYIFQKNASYRGQNLDGFRRFVAKKVKYPYDAAKNEIQGRVIVEFCVNSKGKVCDIFVLKSPDELLSQSAIKAIRKSKLWEPGIQEGKKVKQKFVIPLDYKLGE